MIEMKILVIMPDDDCRKEIITEITASHPLVSLTLISDIEAAKKYVARLHPDTYNTAVVSAFEDQDMFDRAKIDTEGVAIAAQLHRRDRTLPILGISTGEESNQRFSALRDQYPIISYTGHYVTQNGNFHFSKWMKRNPRVTPAAPKSKDTKKHYPKHECSY